MSSRGPPVVNEEAQRAARWPLAALVALVCLGVALDAAGVFDWHEALTWARLHAQSWWLAVVLIAAQAALFMFALPGSAFLWVVAPLYPPALASVILALGGTLGGLAAYALASRLTAQQLEQLRRRRLYSLVARHADFPALLALRLIPAFPHAVINYGAGILRVPLAAFAAAALLGLGAKSFLYASVIHAALQAQLSELASMETVLPLVALAALALLGGLLRRRLERRRAQHVDRSQASRRERV